MMREEAIARIKDHMEHHGIGKYPSIMLGEALDLAISALRGPTREMAERMRGEWERIVDAYGKTEGFLCKCGYQSPSADNFCPACGAPMTDEAVDILWQRWKEALKDG